MCQVPILLLGGTGGRVGMRRVDERRATTALVTVAALCVAGISALTPGHAYAGDPSPPLLPDRSVTQPPERVAADVGASEVARVSALQQSDDGTVEIVSTRIRGTAAAEQTVADLQDDPDTVSVAVADPVRALTDDPEAGRQWALTTLRLPDAWRYSTGSGVVVAVVDSGADTTHPDLADNLVAGVDVVGAGVRTTVSDGNGHGTHVSGTVAAVTHNGVGVAGAAPLAKVMPVKVLNSSGSGYTDDVAEGVVYAVDHGAQVINLSLGSTSYNAVLAQAVAYARAQGVVVVAAAGNSRGSGSPVMYPAALPGVIAVAATDASDNDASFSNIGSYVDIAAPGVSIRSTVPGGGYASWSGTSMASPHVAAVAALLRSAVPRAGDVEDLLLTTATDLGPAGADDATGHGLVNPVAALTQAGVTQGPTWPPATQLPDPPAQTPPAPSPPAVTTPPAPPVPDPPAPVAVPGVPTDLRATLLRRSLLLTWQPPATGSVTHYSARVGKVSAGKVRWRSWTTGVATQARFTVSKGTWVVQVYASNTAGNGPVATATTRISKATAKAARSKARAASRSAGAVVLRLR